MMKNLILEFDKRKVSLDEMAEHYNYYMSLVKEGYNYLKQGDKRSARQCLKQITDSLRSEYKYYTLGKVNAFIWKLNNRIIIDYTQGIYEAYVKVVRANSYQYLSSNLNTVEYYLRYYFKQYIQ